LFKNFSEHLASNKVAAWTGPVGAFSQTPEVWCCSCRKTATSSDFREQNLRKVKEFIMVNQFRQQKMSQTTEICWI
jgi:hypothetical protein